MTTFGLGMQRFPVTTPTTDTLQGEAATTISSLFQEDKQHEESGNTIIHNSINPAQQANHQS